MAGSYRHVTHAGGDGSLRVPTGTDEAFDQMIENLGDAYEAVEEMYGMIWFLASHAGLREGKVDLKAVVERARRNYEEGLEIAKRASQPDVVIGLYREDLPPGELKLSVVHRPAPPLEAVDIRFDLPKDVKPWLKGTTAAGRTVMIEKDPYLHADVPILIDGIRSELVGRRFGAIQRRRDGGTTTIFTDMGTIHRPAPRKELPSTLDDEIINEDS